MQDNRIHYVSFRHFMVVAGASLFALNACNSLPKAPKSVSLEELMDGQSMEDADRDKIIIAAHERANKELDAGNPRAALHFAEIAERFEPDNAQTHFLIGRANMAQGNYEAALKGFKIVNAEQKTPVSLEYQGLAEYFTKRFEAAKSTLEAAYSQDETLWQTASVLGRIYRSEANIEQSDEMFERAFETAPDAAPVHDHQGYAFLERQQWNQAVLAFEKAQSLSNNSVGMHGAYRVAKAKVGDMAGALALATDNQSAQLYLDLAKIEIADGNRVEAVRLLRRAKAASPQFNAEIEQLLVAAAAMKS